MRLTNCGLCLCLGAALPTWGQDDAARFAEVLAANPPRDDVACSYTTTTSDSEGPGETRTERHRDRVAVDLSEFAAGDIRVALENADMVAFEFSPAPFFEASDEAPEGGDMDDKLLGTLVVGKPGLRPQRLVLVLEAPFSPAPMVKVTEFRHETTFAVDAATDATVPTEMVTALRGRALVFSRFENEERVVFSDYDCRGGAVEASSAGAE